MTEGQFNSILSFFLESVPTREAFKENEEKFFQVITKKFGLTKSDFARKLAEKLGGSWDPPFSEEELVELAHRVNAYPVYLAIAKRLPIETVKKEFPSLEKKVLMKAEQVAPAAPAPGTSFTSTANVAKYPVPIGSAMLRRKPKKRK